MPAAPAGWQVYLLHFDATIGNTASQTGYARHYTGSTPDLERRLAEHATRSNVRIMQAVRAAGIGWQLARTWPGGRVRERQLKTQGGAARHCPVCKGQPPRIGATPPRPPAQPRCRAAGVAEPAPLWASMACYLEPADAEALVEALEAAEHLAWRQITPPGTPGHEARMSEACEISRLCSAEASAVRRLDEARRQAEAEGWWPGPPAVARAPEPELEAG